MEPVLCPTPEGLAQQQVIRPLTFLTLHVTLKKLRPVTTPKLTCFYSQLVRRCILGSILESEKNYLDALKRILEVCE